MEVLLLLVSGLCSVVCLVCWVLVLIKMFQEAGVGSGIFGIICGLYALIHGWQNNKEYGITIVMWIWTIAMLISFGLNVMIRMAAA
jgi:hypothetical protein